MQNDDATSYYADLTERVQESIDLGGDAEDFVKTVRMWLSEVEGAA